ncbi:tRNA lysidine(34) synthetase TilS [Bosea sp. 117]|uniref:tRNA lysidine(34) synthetase TilS n=1 Tax=Bosea sp. 117 TaxID=1125973 RepID=UPI0009E06981|nr:tRNA lysidine(34) synthetase TilS [Bosea sp. 117]
MCAAEAAPAAAAAVEAARLDALFRPFEDHAGVLLAVSGGPDSTALLLLAARWRTARADGPALYVATVDHGLRAGARAEAEAVGTLAARLGMPHAILDWEGEKPMSGLQEAARDARYALLADHAHTVGASAIATAHTADDQAETVLFRLLRGSGLAGLAGIPAARPLDGLTLLRPLLGIGKAELTATCRAAGIAFAEDPSNRDERFARVRLRASLLPALAAAGLDADGFARLAERMARADAALEAATDAAAARLLAEGPVFRLPRAAFAELPAEIALRLLGRAIDRVGREGPVELGKLEALHRWIAEEHAAGGAAASRAPARTLAGAVVRLGPKALTVGPAPARRAPASASFVHADAKLRTAGAPRTLRHLGKDQGGT